MARCIDADILKVNLKKIVRDDFLYDLVCCVIDDAHSTDIIKIKHGRWKFDPLAGDWICLECGLHSMEYGHFCPNCGAKMMRTKKRNNK